MSVNPPLRLLAEFGQIFPDAEPSWLVQAPGRDMWVAAQITDQGHHVIHAPDCEVSQAAFDYRSARLQQTIRRRPLPRWSRYLAGVLVELSEAQPELSFPGVSAVIIGEEPSGPRYDYGMGLAFAAFWCSLNDQPCDADALQTIVERVQRSYIGS